jgi:hypothetical protein
MVSTLVQKSRLAFLVIGAAMLAFAAAASPLFAAPAVSFRAYGQGFEPSITPD